MYTSAIAVDFGSSNSGAARIDTVKEGHLIYSTPVFCHSDGYYAKDPTWFWISPDLLNKAIHSYSRLEDSDFRILSRNFQSTQNPNVVWGTDFFMKEGPGNIKKLNTEGWVEFKHFKMMIYLDVPYSFKNREYPIELVVKIFMRILKIECLARESASKGRAVDSSEIQWGITIPSIWTASNKELMTRICTEVFGKHIRILSEPEGPIISERIHAGSGKLALNKGTRNLVIDIGGGTTDISLLEDNDIEEEVKFTQLASCDGIGIGGNIIDHDFRHFLVKFFSKGLKSDNGVEYNSLGEKERFHLLYGLFSADPVNDLIMEKAWLLYKHRVSDEYQVPKQYIQWLDKNGHREVANRVRDFILGEICFDVDEFEREVFRPTFNKIYDCVRNFVSKNIELVKSGSSLNIIFAGGLSLMQHLRNGVVAIVNELTGRENSYNISNTSLLASGSIMDGAAYILLYRKAISRIAPFYIYDPMGNIDLSFLKKAYAVLGLDVKLGTLNQTMESETSANQDINTNVLGVPVAVKGKPFKDYSAKYIAANENQTRISLQFYGSQKMVVLPLGNRDCWLLGEDEIPNSKGDNFSCVVDFNESETSGNLHYYVKNEVSGVTREGNLVIKNMD